VLSESKARWQQVTALVSLGASGTITGFSFVPSSPADLTSPTSMPIRLMALEKSATAAPADDAALRSAIVNVANYYLRMAQGQTPAEMEAIIWQHDSIDGVDHGESCAAFASLTLELAAQVVGQQSWVTGGTTYPWPLHKWADVRVDTNPDSPNIISVQQDAESHGRWHPLGDGYAPQPGDWVLFDGHVEVVTKYAGGVLSTIGGDSLPNFSVNAHEYSDPLAGQGVVGFVNNGNLAPAAGQASPPGGAPAAQPSGASGAQPSAPAATAQATPGSSAIPGAAAAGSTGSTVAAQASDAAIPGVPGPAAIGSHARPSRHRARPGHWHAAHGTKPRQQANPAPAVAADVPGASVYGPSMAPGPANADSAAIPGLATSAKHASGPTSPYRRHRPAPSTAPVSAASAQQVFINAVAPGAMATQRRYGVPAAVTIAQAIDESGWGQSMLATNDHNLFGIKGTGPAGSDVQPTEEYENGQWITTNAPFRVYHNFAQSIEDHGDLLATSGYYTQAMANRSNPDAFANDLTGVYATNPEYGADLINLMQQYNLYRYDAGPPSPAHAAPRPSPGRTAPPRPARTSPGPAPSSAPSGSSPSSVSPAPTAPAPSPSGSQPTPTASQPAPSASQPTPATPQPAPSASWPTQATPGTSPAAADPVGGSPSWPNIPGVTASPPARSPATAGPAPGRGRSPGPARRTPARGQAPARQGAPAAARTSEPTPAASPTSAPEPTTQSFSYQHLSADMAPVRTTSAFRPTTPDDRAAARKAPRKSRPAPARYELHLPPSVKNAFFAAAKSPLTRSELLYRDVAGQTGIPWQLLAACDWMQCEARPRYSPVHGEKLGAVNADGTAFRTKSAALEQCAYDLIDLAGSVYGIDLTARRLLSVCDLASAFAAFRWGGLLRQHHTSPMEFPYSVAGLTVQHQGMRWPNINEPHTPDKPGGRFRRPFGAVPVVLSLHYPATA
jgi:flagellum-specific peptidoglycan hydrolase FlgJ